MNVYRPLPVVQTRLVSNCRDCKHVWMFVDTPVGCDLLASVFWGPRRNIDMAARARAEAGTCEDFSPRPWIKLLHRLGLRKMPRRVVVD